MAIKPVCTTWAQWFSLPLQQSSQFWQTSIIGLMPARSPTFQSLTFAPSFTTIPAPSCPGERTPNCDIGGARRSFNMK